MLDFVERHDAAAQVCTAAGLRGTSLEMSLRYAERRDEMPLDYMERHDVTDDYGNVLYNVTAVQAMPTAPAYKVTYTEGPATFVPAPAPSGTVGDVTLYDVPAKYGIPTSTDRIDALEAQAKQQAATIAALETYIRDHSERDDVPFGTLRMAEDAWSVGG